MLDEELKEKVEFMLNATIRSLNLNYLVEDFWKIINWKGSEELKKIILNKIENSHWILYDRDSYPSRVEYLSLNPWWEVFIGELLDSSDVELRMCALRNIISQIEFYLPIYALFVDDGFNYDNPKLDLQSERRRFYPTFPVSILERLNALIDKGTDEEKLKCRKISKKNPIFIDGGLKKYFSWLDERYLGSDEAEKEYPIQRFNVNKLEE